MQYGGHKDISVLVKWGTDKSFDGNFSKGSKGGSHYRVGSTSRQIMPKRGKKSLTNGDKPKQKIDVAKLIGRPTSVICRTIELWPLIVFYGASMSPRLSDECLKVDRQLSLNINSIVK